MTRIKLYKIPDKNIFRAIFVIIALWNLKYFFLIAQIPFTLMFAPYFEKNSFYSEMSAIRNETKIIKNFQDEGKIGFVSNIQQANVFDLQESIKAFYIAQYAIVPSVLKNDTDENYVIGSFEKGIVIPQGFKIYKKVDEKNYIFKRINK